MPEDGDRLPVVLMATVPFLVVRVAAGFLRFQSSRKKGVRRFRSALVEGGMPPADASRLAQAYHEAGSIREILRGTFPGAPR